MDQIILQILNGLDKGSAYALIALGLTLIFGTLGVVNFAHGALFMLGAFCAVTLSRILTISHTVIDETKKDFLGNPLKVEVPYVNDWFGETTGQAIIDIVLQEIVKYYYGANQIPTPAPEAFIGSFDFGALIGMDPGSIIYPYWRIVYFCFAMVLIGAVFAFLQFTTFGMVVRAGMADRETVGLLGINIDRRFTVMFGIAAAVAGLAGVMYTPINPPNYHMGMDFLVISFVVVVVGGMGSLPGAILAGLVLGILESFASMRQVI
ncbi:MAG: branched-chain amino acid ABC transporter permease, partial [Rhodobacteraceae bacterium]|nr:branched-chain amino acid ABC transporter permease [Paracoccaceae bacterium]